MVGDTIFLRNESNNTENDNRGVSEVFSNNLDEFIVDSEFAQKEVQCSICLDEFKEGDKCIRLPCKGEPHIFHSGSDSCSGVRPWLERNNTCPMCRHEFPKKDNSERNSLSPEQVAGIILNPNSLENTITNLLEDYIRDGIDGIDGLPVGIDGLPVGLTNEEDDLQRAIELSLNDIS